MAGNGWEDRPEWQGPIGLVKTHITLLGVVSARRKEKGENQARNANRHIFSERSRTAAEQGEVGWSDLLGSLLTSAACALIQTVRHALPVANLHVAGFVTLAKFRDPLLKIRPRGGIVLAHPQPERLIGGQGFE